MTEPDADPELAAALAHVTGERLSKLLVMLVEVAARTHPDLLRDAIGRVFDLSLVEGETGKALARLRWVQQEALALRQEVQDLRNQLNDLRQPPAVVLRRPEPKRTA